MKKKWIMGAGLIAIGSLISLGVSFLIIQSGYFMFRPENRNILLCGIFFIPAIIYWAAYGLWYSRCAKSKERTIEVYRYEKPLVVFVIVLDVTALLIIFGVCGILDEAWLHIIISTLISGLFFGVAFLRSRPF